jgi:hypothetical protein
MKGEAVKCDNCGNIEFFSDPYSRYGRLAFIFKDYLEDEQEEPVAPKRPPSKWLSVVSETYNTKTKAIDEIVKHFCSVNCLEFAVRYMYNNKEVPTTLEGEK